MSDPIYTAITFAPVQGFIEKSRKLRDLYGASEILSYLSKSLVDAADQYQGVEVISPGLPNVEQGMPNRILLKGDFPQELSEHTLIFAWKEVLRYCREWVEDNLRHLGPYDEWKREWTKWANHSWEIFWAQGNSPTMVMRELETCKLGRNWIAVNWIAESSSLTGTDGIAFPGLGKERRNPIHINYREEKTHIENFYTALATITESTRTPVEGRFIAPNEKLSIPELTKRLVTWPPIASRFGMESLDKGFRDIQRKPTENTPGQWTGWFMGDGDRVGRYLQDIAETEADERIRNFSHDMRTWGQNFRNTFSPDFGRVIYAGGDDFLGVIYSDNPANPIPAFSAYEWLMSLSNTWEEHGHSISLSVGFVWAAGSVPQRDVLQHCRETQKRSKNLGRRRVTIRVVFNSGQYVQWTCPWDYLHILKRYRDRNGNTYEEWECRGRDAKYQPNWTHIYTDLAQLKARHAIDLKTHEDHVDDRLALALFDIYFHDREHLINHAEYIVGKDSPKAIIQWINDLINVGWQLCTNI
ncbi:CRISPR-associated protein Cmr2 [Mastigocladus laminosus UU774]|nr:CRISPR-associated protein Cmr2 [Mastigocladus laminosus UU774]